MSITIDRGVSVPRVPRQTRCPWHAMRPGDSFFVPGKKLNHTKGSGQSFTTLPGRRIHPGSQWKMRTVTEAGVDGVRVWRVA